MTIIPAIILAVNMAVSGGETVAPMAESPQPTRPAPARTVPDKGRKVVHGSATWYDYRPGHAAAGPALRKALGRGWRGMTVRVCGLSTCTRVVLSDWCACKGNRVIDLDVRSFARLAPPSRGVIEVVVR